MKRTQDEVIRLVDCVHLLMLLTAMPRLLVAPVVQAPALGHLLGFLPSKRLLKKLSN